MNRRISLITGSLLLALCTASAVADSWALPTARTYHSANGEHAVTIAPKQLAGQLEYFEDKVEGREDAGGLKGLADNRPYASLFTVDAHAPSVLRSRFPLVNEVAPVTALISNDGSWLVTLDNWHSIGYGPDVLVIYRTDGTMVRSLALEDLFTADDLDVLPRSVSSRYWSKDARIDDDHGHVILEVTRCSLSVDCPDQPSILRIRLADGVPTEPTRDLFPHLVGEATVALADFTYVDCPSSGRRVDPQPLTSMVLSYPPAARKARLVGEVGLRGEIAADGSVNSVTVVASVNPLLDAAAVRGLMSQAFSPARCGDRATATHFTALGRFSLSLKHPQ